MKKLLKRILRFLGFGKSPGIARLESPIRNFKGTQSDSEDKGNPDCKEVKRRKSHAGYTYRVYEVPFEHFTDIESIEHTEDDFLSEEINLLVVSEKYQELTKTPMYNYFSDLSNERTYRKFDYRVVEIEPSKKK